MLIGLGGYNPIDVMRRTRRYNARKLQVAREGKMKKKTKKKIAGRPEGDVGLLWDAYRFLYDLEKLWVPIGDAIKRLNDMAVKATNMNMADTERTSIQRLYVGGIRNLDYAVKHAKLDGVAVFSGVTEDHPISRNLDSKGEKSISISIPSFIPQDIRLHLTKVEEIVSARKAVKKFEEINSKLVGDFFKAIKAKENFLEILRKQKGMERPNFDAPVEELDEDEASVLDLFDEGQKNSEFESKSLVCANLKKRMDRAAQAKGRTTALLVNFKL